MTVGTDEKPTKALFEHCKNVFAEMQKEAEPETQRNEWRDDETGLLSGSGDEVPTGYQLYTGHLTRIFQSLELATPYYTSVMGALRKMGCVEQIRRGGGNSPSKWRLIREPEESLFEAAEKLKKPPQGSVKALEQQVAALIQRMNNVEKAVGIQ